MNPHFVLEENTWLICIVQKWLQRVNMLYIDREISMFDSEIPAQVWWQVFIKGRLNVFVWQGELPSKSGRNLAGQLRSLGSRTSRDYPLQEFQPSTTLCMLLNDLREIRSKQADLASELRGKIDGQWWGKEIDATKSGQQTSRLGDRFKACQVHFIRLLIPSLKHHCKGSNTESWKAVGQKRKVTRIAKITDIVEAVGDTRKVIVTTWNL